MSSLLPFFARLLLELELELIRCSISVADSFPDFSSAHLTTGLSTIETPSVLAP